MAAAAAAEVGARVVLVEKNARLGRKLAITGKGRGNITNATDIQGLIANIPGNGSFLYSAFTAFSSEDTIAFFHRLGVETKVERGGRVFPVSGRALDVVRALEQYLRQLGVEIRLRAAARAVEVSGGHVRGVRPAAGDLVAGERVVLATGGASYPATGSTGDGYLMAADVGHTIIAPRPSLAPLETAEPWVPGLAGLSLRNVNLTAWDGRGRVLAREFGEMLFTHTGISGPIVLTASRAIIDCLDAGPVRVALDLKPALTLEQLDLRLQRDLGRYSRREFRNALGDLLPKAVIPIVVELSGIEAGRRVHQVTRSERLELGRLLKEMPMTVIGARPLAEAIVTAGGVSVREIDPRTMESKLVAGLYFAGELIDVDGYTGGYNLQAAFSTGRVAGIAAAGTGAWDKPLSRA